MGGEGWDDDFLPGFEPAPLKPARGRNAQKDAEDARRIRYIRWKGAALSCQDCLTQRGAAGAGAVATAAFIRTDKHGEKPLCFNHRALRGEREALGRG